MSRDGLEGTRIPFGSGIAGHVAATGETVMLEDAYSDPRFLQDIDVSTGFHTRNILCMPVPGFTRRQAPVAVIQVLNRKPGRVHCFDMRDQWVLKAFCNEVSFILQQRTLELALLRVSNGGAKAQMEKSLLEGKGQGRQGMGG